MQLSMAVIISWRFMPEWMAAARMPRASRCCTWSFIKAIKGVMTMHVPSQAKAGTWNVIDLPPPVGISPRVSRPAEMLSMMSRCMPRKSS